VLEPETYASVADAFHRLSSLTRVLPRIEKVRAIESYGRVLAEDLLPKVDVPPHSLSHMDGYAVNASDLAEATEQSPARLRMKGEVLLGRPYRERLGTGEAIRVPTGGFIPEGANAVVPVERTKLENEFVLVSKYHSRGSFIYPKGADVKRGRRVLQRGHQLRPQDVALLLSLGIREVGVYRRPRVAIVATGDELTDSLEGARRGQLLNTHGYIFSKFIEELGGVPIDLGVVEDNVPKIAHSVGSAVEEADMVLTIGGTSLGSLDMVGQALSKFVRPSHIIHGIKMDRGRVAGVTVIKGKPLVMLPGPIQGAMSAFLLFVVPMIRAIGGHDTRGRPPLKAVLREAWEARRRFPYFTKVMYVKLGITEHGLEARPIRGETESLTILTEANGYVVVPEQRIQIPKGGTVEVHLLPGFSYLGDRFLD